ncbi:MAG: BppU family phage baseplate upper protein [Steroidobacteraceae bacterium]
MISLKQYDTARKIAQQLTVDGEPINLAGVTVYLQWKRLHSQDPVVLKTASIANASEGRVEYQPDSTDFAVAGDYEMEWRIQFSGTQRLTVPTENRIQVKVSPALA